MIRFSCLIACAILLLPSAAAQTPDTTTATQSRYDPELARSLGADENGMRKYVLVILKTGPTKVPAGAERDAMFKGHFANMARLSAEGKLALAGPFDGADGWRGLFILAVSDIEEARQLVSSDPVIAKGEMVPEFHIYYGSAALMLVRDTHARISKQNP